MLSTVMVLHEGLGASRRLPVPGQTGVRVSAVELAILIGLGAVAALLSAVGGLRLGVPGHNIIRVAFPMALGLSLVPRRGSATLMGMGGLGTAALLSAGGLHGFGMGALTSLTLTGLFLDVALLGVQGGRSVYFRIAMACLATNVVAMLVRFLAKLGTGGMIDGWPLDDWWPRAILTYPATGLVAGALSAIAWFRANPPSR